MHIVTCGDGRRGTDAHGRLEDGPTFAEMIAVSVRQARGLGYGVSVFDLGGLGMGERYQVEDDTFRRHGYYRQVSPSWKSKALHKPDIVRRALRREPEILYLDGDAILIAPIERPPPEVDLMVTLRLPHELDSPDWHANREIAGLINAGVILFRASDRMDQFIDRWSSLSAHLGSDQWALNQLVAPASLAAVGSVEVHAGLRVMYVSSREYNFYHFGHPPARPTRVLHFKGGKRGLFRRIFPGRASDGAQERGSIK